MLIEFQDVRQVEGEGPRRWFFDDYFDLIVWYKDNGEIDGFQLCYDKTGSERALTWNWNHGYRHHKIDDGEMPFAAKMSPILVQDGLFDRESVGERFSRESADVPPDIREFVLDKLKGFSL